MVPGIPISTVKNTEIKNKGLQKTPRLDSNAPHQMKSIPECWTSPREWQIKFKLSFPLVHVLCSIDRFGVWLSLHSFFNSRYVGQTVCNTICVTGTMTLWITKLCCASATGIKCLLQLLIPRWAPIPCDNKGVVLYFNLKRHKTWCGFLFRMTISDLWL